MIQSEKVADAATGISAGSWIISVATDALPVVQLIAGIASIIAAAFAIRFYYKSTSK